MWYIHTVDYLALKRTEILAHATTYTLRILLLKSRDITLLTKVHVVKAMVFPVVTYGCGSWTIKKVERQRTDAFELWCWRRLLRVPWTRRRSNQSILKEITPEYSLEGLMLKLKFQYLSHLMWRSNSLEKTWCWERLKARGEGDDRGQDGWMASLTQWTWVWASSRRWWRTWKPSMLQSVGSQRVGHDWTTTNACWNKLVSQRQILYDSTYMKYQEQIQIHRDRWLLETWRKEKWKLFDECRVSVLQDESVLAISCTKGKCT